MSITKFQRVTSPIQPSAPLSMPLRGASAALLRDRTADSDEEEVLPGFGKSWGKYIVRNTDRASSEKHPYSCALAGCKYRYTKSMCNATKVGWHICGVKNVKSCDKALEEHRIDFPALLKKMQADRPVALAIAYSNSAGTIPSSELPPNNNSQPAPPNGSASGRPTEMTLAEIVALQEAESIRQRALESNMNSLPTILAHVVNKNEAERLNILWAKALHHAGIPPNAIEDDYIRDAIFETSKCQVRILVLTY